MRATCTSNHPRILQVFLLSLRISLCLRYVSGVKVRLSAAIKVLIEVIAFDPICPGQYTDTESITPHSATFSCPKKWLAKSFTSGMESKTRLKIILAHSISPLETSTRVRTRVFRPGFKSEKPEMGYPVIQPVLQYGEHGHEWQLQSWFVDANSARSVRNFLPCLVD